AGADAVGGVLVLMFYFLIESPKWLALLRSELEASKERAPTQWLRSLDKLDILNAVIQEGLRLGTPLPGLPRVIPDDGAIIDGHHVSGGTSVSVPIWGYHLSKEYFPNPATFRPDRWLPGRLGSTSRTDETALTSFSTGPDVCVAKAFAYQEMRYTIARLVLTFDFELARNFDCGKFEAGVSIIQTALFREPLLVSARRRFDTELPVC
ncbi:cytochrome P450, partial [Roridomyces roridus]